MAGERHAQRPRVRRHPACGVNHGHLAQIATRICSQQPGQRLRSRIPLPHQIQASRTITAFDGGLRGHGAHSRQRPGHTGTNPKPVRLHGHAQLAAHRIPRDDGEGMSQRCGRRSMGHQISVLSDSSTAGFVVPSAAVHKPLRTQVWPLSVVEFPGG